MKTMKYPQLYNEAMRFWGPDTVSRIGMTNMKALSGEYYISE